MANFKKLQIFTSTILLESIVISLMLYILLFLNKDLEKLYQVNGLEITYVLVNMFIVGVVIALGLNLLLIIINKIFREKYYFFTHLPNQEGKWYLLRKSTKNRILLMDEKGRFLFHEDWNGLIFERKMFPPNKLQLFLYGTEKRYFNTLLTFILSGIALSILYFVVELELIHRYLIMCSSFVMLAIATIIYRSKRMFSIEN
ncbi:hypothetical protein [Lysinibacillus fusiformis]|uniref:hypothetical protein n=1 Tax=Lysinibacillus fusiformis TaxID=28031 RepID=UPI00263BD895|nr:hypothetical protein [Lysinibacillus fusiformis]MDC6267997.1 hypothetical protein [Lysinibacillus sphaericus]MDN4967513.1 hypothetical protein [Lysinibacillus fusiformis]